MNKILLFMLAVVMLSACSQQKEEADAGAQDAAGAATEAPVDRDISTATLVKLDPEIQKYDTEVAASLRAYEADKNDENEAYLINAYIKFGDYMQYESPVSPREGKYHRALVEYRNALELDPQNSKALGEIAQIEAVYHSMNRPVPGSE